MPIRLILFSGLAADHDVFAPQSLAFEQLIVPVWPEPEPGDTLDSYSKRLADDLRSTETTVIGGASFGGIVALHVAKYLDPLAVILIGSVRGPSELPRYARVARYLKPCVSRLPVGLLQKLTSPLDSRVIARRVPHLSGLARQFQHCSPAVFKWSLARILDWDSSPTLKCPVFQIHGDRDRVLPIQNVSPTQVVAGGGHVISLTHPAEVIAFIRFVEEEVSE
ncbi:alpha/beta hydrolase [Novipirellula caenicola]|uniref:alpha/beta fold hydrolase n=1 Tax=Novipirellula caenicola TaxID=1536901 RepID=UPI0031EB9D47